MKINYNLDALSKMDNESLEKIFNENTNPTLEMVLKKLKRKHTKKKKSK